MVQAHSLIAQFQRPLCDERRLLPRILARNKRGFCAGLTRGRKFLCKLVHVRGDGGVRDVKDFRRAAVIRFDLENLCAGITLRKFQDVREVRAAPGVDALRVVADDHDVMMLRGEQVNQVALELVRILIFVHEDELKSALVMFAHFGIVLQQFQPQREQVVEVHRVRGTFAGDVTLLLVGNLLDELGEITELAVH